MEHFYECYDLLLLLNLKEKLHNRYVLRILAPKLSSEYTINTVPIMIFFFMSHG